MRSIIMADGRARRWYNQIQNQLWGEDKTKQLVEVDGEPILHRTVRLLHENSIEDIWITSHRKEHEVEGAKRFEPEINFDKFYAAKPIWNTDETLFVYGDVFYTKEAMKTIVNTPVDEFCFFGQFSVSPLTGHGGEIYGVRICGESGFWKFGEAILNVWVRKELGKGNAGAWEIYRYMSGAREVAINRHELYGNSHYVEIADLTDDFDTPEHYNHWLEVYNEHR